MGEFVRRILVPGQLPTEAGRPLDLSRLHPREVWHALTKCKLHVPSRHTVVVAAPLNVRLNATSASTTERTASAVGKVPTVLCGDTVTLPQIGMVVVAHVYS